MRTKLLAIASTLLMVVGLVSLGAGPANAGIEDNTNGVTYWQTLYNTSCIKYDVSDNSNYGAVTNDQKAVTLNTSATWQYLIVNAGSNDHVVTAPEANTPYYPPLNQGNQKPIISHWIICGMTPTPTPTADSRASAQPLPATCEAAGGVTFDISNATWENTDDVTDGSRNAIADDGHTFSDGTTTLAVTYTIAPKLTCAPDVKYATPTQPTAVAGTAICQAGVSTGTNGTITLPPFDHGHWAEGSGTLTNVAPGEYAFTAVADSGYVLADRDGLDPGYAVWIVTVPASTPIDCSTPPTVLQCTTITSGPVSTNLNPNGWDFSDSRSEGHHAYVAGGLHIWTTGPDLSLSKSAGYVPVSFPLSQAGTPSMDYTATSGASAGLNLSITVDGVWAGNLVQEPLFDKFWGTRAIPGVPAGPNSSYQHAYGTLNEILADSVGHDIQVVAVGYSLGSGAIGDGVVNSITAGCVNYTFDYTTISVLPEIPTASDVCGVVNDVVNVPKNTDDIHYTVKDERVNGVGTVTVKASPTTDRVIPKGTQRLFTFTFTDAPCPTAVIPGDPVAQDETCVAGNRTSGSVWVDLKDGVEYTIDGQPVTSATTLVKPGDHVVTATALDGFVLSGDTHWPYTVTVHRADNCGFEFPTESVVTPTVASNNLTCKADGSFTLGEADGIADAIVWKVDGNVVTAGTHTVSKKGTHVVTAVPAEGHGFDFGIDNPSTWTLSFTDPMDCGDLTTLALPGETLAATGTDGGSINLGLLFASGLLFLGGALVIAEKRFRYGK
ncbi:hypothetical protein GCM10027052_21070 [Parafrigoribacterium mesophilum]|uniref:hypothetical protein n=1 Tax=Parafrigoribacterium mesophilum TaxID=433646 RepID=UPI0031FCF3A9